MSAGNLKNDALKGNNHPFQFNLLRAVGKLVTSSSTTGLATELTLSQVLAAVQQGTDFEARLVTDSLGVVWLEVRTWDTVGHVWNPVQYYAAGSNVPGAPTMPVVYIDNSTVLSLIESNTADISLDTTALIALLTGISRTPSIDTDLGAGSTTPGVKGFSIWFRGGNTGTLGTPAVTVPNGSRWTFRADDNNDTVDSMAYSAPVGGSVFITYLT